MHRTTRFKPNLNKIEIDLTYACNLRCAGCNRSCSQAPADLHLPLHRIEEFLASSLATGHHWESIHLLGGEPTLHPDFLAIVSMIETWADRHSPMTELKVVSNGHGTKTQKLLQAIDSKRWVHAKSHKDSPYQDFFEPFNQAPIDQPGWETEDYSRGCWITLYCGIGLTPLGYFPCAVAGGIERVFGFGLGHGSFSNNSLDSMLQVYCRFCGHFLQENYRPRPVRLGNFTDKLSPSWQCAYESWKERELGENNDKNSPAK